MFHIFAETILNKRKVMEKTERKQLKKRLRHGEMKQICDLTGFSYTSVYEFFEGRNDHEEIGIAAAGIIEVRIKKLRDSIQNLQK